MKMQDTKIQYIDANVFLRFFVLDEKNPHLSKAALRVFSSLEKGRLTVQTNILVVAEVVHILESYYKLENKEIFMKLLPILNLPNLILPGKEKVLSALQAVADYNVDFEDAYTYFDMLSNEIREIITFDVRHFERLEGITVVQVSY